MGRDLQVWQYGLVAEMWAAGTRETRELEFLRSAIETYGQPVLDPGCGAGRLLIPLCEAGTEIDGADISPDMLASCQARLDRLGLSAELFTGPMQLLELPRKYRVILIADSFGLAGGRAMDGQTRRRAFEHLEPGGVLILNKEAPDALDD